MAPKEAGAGATGVGTAPCGALSLPSSQPSPQPSSQPSPQPSPLLLPRRRGGSTRPCTTSSRRCACSGPRWGPSTATRPRRSTTWPRCSTARASLTRPAPPTTAPSPSRCAARGRHGHEHGAAFAIVFSSIFSLSYHSRSAYFPTVPQKIGRGPSTCAPRLCLEASCVPSRAANPRRCPFSARRPRPRQTRSTTYPCSSGTLATWPRPQP